MNLFLKRKDAIGIGFICRCKLKACNMLHHALRCAKPAAAIRMTKK